MAPRILYTACVLGAIGLYLVIRPGGAERARSRLVVLLGAVLGLGALGFLVFEASEVIPGGAGSTRPEAFYLIFSLIAVVSAVKMVASSRPVYAALYFVLVVLSSAGLFLLLEAEFMAFALIIVYAGAILITYMFVLMLAQQAPTPDDPSGQPEYDLNPREPAAGAVVGFVLLALLSRMILEGTTALPAPPSASAVRAASWDELSRMPKRLEEFVAREAGGPFRLGWDGDQPPMRTSADGDTAIAYFTMEDGTRREMVLPEAAMPENVQSVGLGLVSPRFPASLELAGVILLMAMFGAVILARWQIELTEDEKREAAGLRRLGHHDEAEAQGGGG
jgi:NADH-quinone oxidoreductase subunit J